VIVGVHAVLGLAGSTAEAGCPWSSTADARVVVCPAGDVPFRIDVLRGPVPQPGEWTGIGFPQCSSLRFAEPDGSESYQIFADGFRWQRADANGISIFRLRAGGTCTGDVSIDIGCDGSPVPGGTPRLVRAGATSPDQNGDLLVDHADLAMIEGKIGSADRTGDLDGNGAVTVHDVEYARAHLGHASAQPTPAVTGSWGRLKSVYR
jgi:hypothetical protein